MTTDQREDALRLAKEAGMAVAPVGNGYWNNANQLVRLIALARAKDAVPDGMVLVPRKTISEFLRVVDELIDKQPGDVTLATLYDWIEATAGAARPVVDAAPAAEPVAWGIFGYFPEDGWCLQAGRTFTCVDTANAFLVTNYENDGDWRVQPLYAAPQPQEPSDTSDDVRDKRIAELERALSQYQDPNIQTVLDSNVAACERLFERAEKAEAAQSQAAAMAGLLEEAREVKTVRCKRCGTETLHTLPVRFVPTCFGARQ